MRLALHRLGAGNTWLTRTRDGRQGEVTYFIFLRLLSIA